MIFREEMAQAILAGLKTETRRMPTDNPRSPWYRERCAYRLDQIFTINPGRGVRRVAEARVVREPWLERIGHIDDEAAQREGFDGRNAFLAYFEDINGSINWSKGPDATPLVWVVRFELVGSCA